MDLDSIIKSVRQNKLDLEDNSILKSKEFEEYIKSISSKLYEKYNLNQDKLKFLFDKNIDDVSYIKKDTIYINLASKSINEGNKLKLILGYYAHEIGHRLFTNFTIRDIYEESILSGSLLEDLLEFDDKELNENM